MSNKIFIIFLGLILTVSCVEEFQVPNTVSGRYKSELVIQGASFPVSNQHFIYP